MRIGTWFNAIPSYIDRGDATGEDYPSSDGRIAQTAKAWTGQMTKPDRLVLPWFGAFQVQFVSPRVEIFELHVLSHRLANDDPRDGKVVPGAELALSRLVEFQFGPRVKNCAWNAFLNSN